MQTKSLSDLIWRVLVIFLLWRGALFLALFFGLSLSVEYPGSYGHDSEWHYVPDNYFINGFLRWDADWYEYIAREGYAAKEGSRAVAPAFFPLYPALSRALGEIIGGHLVAGLTISNLSLFLGLIYCYLIGLMHFDRDVVERGIVLLLVFPGSFFFSAFYTEGLYLFLTAASLYYFLSARPGLAGLFGFLACLTRPTGIILLGAMCLALAYQWWRHQQVPKSANLFLLLIPCGLLTYMGLLAAWTGDPFAFAHAQANWSRDGAFPLWTLITAGWAIDWSFPRDMINLQHASNFFCALAFLFIGAWMVVWSLRNSNSIVLAAYLLAGVLMPLSTGSLDSMVRYCSVLFPGFLFISQMARGPIAHSFLVTTFAMLLAVNGVAFMNKFWVV